MKDILKFQQMVRDGVMGRRDFLAALGALGVTGAAATGFLHSSNALAATPRKGGTVRYANNLHGARRPDGPDRLHVGHRLHARQGHL